LRGAEGQPDQRAWLAERAVQRRAAATDPGGDRRQLQPLGRAARRTAQGQRAGHREPAGLQSREPGGAVGPAGVSATINPYSGADMTAAYQSAATNMPSATLFVISGVALVIVIIMIAAL